MQDSTTVQDDRYNEDEMAAGAMRLCLWFYLLQVLEDDLK